MEFERNAVNSNSMKKLKKHTEETGVLFVFNAFN